MNFYDDTLVAEVGHRVTWAIYCENTGKFGHRMNAITNAYPDLVKRDSMSKPNPNDNFLEKKLNGKIQFITSSSYPEEFKQRVENILDLNLPKGSFYIKWSDDE